VLARVLSAALVGVEAALVRVEVDVSPGLPMFTTVGLPDSAVRESRERVRTAIRNAGFAFPSERITVNLAPADLRKEGASFDLPIALGILSATGVVVEGRIGSFAVVGELALNGQIQGVRGVLAVGLTCRRLRIGTLVVPVRVRRPVRLSSLYDDLTQSGQAPTTRLLAYEVVPAPLEVANSLQLSEGTRVLHFERLRLATGQPISLMRNFLPLALKEVVTEEGLKLTGLYRLLRHSGIHLRLASQSIGARSPQPREARLLKVIKTAPLLTMRRISYGDAGQPVEYGSHVYPAERYSFEMSVVADSRT